MTSSEPNLLRHIEGNANSLRGVRLIEQDRSSTFLSWTQVYDRALFVASNLKSHGVSSNDKVAILSTTRIEIPIVLEAVWTLGAIPVMISIPYRLNSVEDFQNDTISRIEKSDASLLIIDPMLSPYFPPEKYHIDQVQIASLFLDMSHQAGQVYTKKEELALIQFTSGATGRPKGVAVSHNQIVGHIEAITKAAEFDPEYDNAVSWLPLYHDMGFIGMLVTQMATGANVTLIKPQDFTEDPKLWLETLDEFHGTITAGPNFAYSIATRILNSHGPYSLSHLRIALNGAETVRPSSIENFVAAGKPHQLNPGSPFCAYGMAEATVAVTFPIPLTGLEVDVIDRAQLEYGKEARKPSKYVDPNWISRFAKLGFPITGTEARIVDMTTNTVLGNRKVGEVEIRGASVIDNYLNSPTLSKDTWLKTDDIGYMAEEQLVVLGRMSNVIVSQDRIVLPEEIENHVGDLENIRKGNVVAFSLSPLSGLDDVVIVAETRNKDKDLTKLTFSTVKKHTGITPSEIVFIKPGSLPKTSSGKLKRSETKSRFISKDLDYC